MRVGAYNLVLIRGKAPHTKILTPSPWVLHSAKWRRHLAQWPRHPAQRALHSPQSTLHTPQRVLHPRNDPCTLRQSPLRSAQRPVHAAVGSVQITTLIARSSETKARRSPERLWSFVLRMLDLLRLAPGHRVLEIGAGSGWNAALMGAMVGPAGHVTSLEIVPELAEGARAAVQRIGASHVEIVTADAGNGYAPGAPYDRVVFTAGAHDLGQRFHEQITDGGLLLIPLKVAEMPGHRLFLLRHDDDHFQSVFSTPCGFVPMTGEYAAEAATPSVIPAELADSDTSLQVWRSHIPVRLMSGQQIVVQPESQFVWTATAKRRFAG